MLAHLKIKNLFAGRGRGNVGILAGERHHSQDVSNLSLGCDKFDDFNVKMGQTVAWVTTIYGHLVHFFVLWLWTHPALPLPFLSFAFPPFTSNSSSSTASLVKYRSPIEQFLELYLLLGSWP